MSVVTAQIRGILFDLDETLFSRDAAFWSWIEAEAASGEGTARLDREMVAELDARGRGDKLKLLDYLNDTLGWHETEQRRLERFRTGLTGCARLEEGIPAMLNRLGERHRLGLVTNGSGATQRAKLERLQLEHFFDPIVISEEAGFRKPDARIFELAIAEWEVPSAAVLVVGDDPVADVQGARDAGMQALRVGHHDGIGSILMLEEWLQSAGQCATSA